LLKIRGNESYSQEVCRNLADPHFVFYLRCDLLSSESYEPGLQRLPSLPSGKEKLLLKRGDRNAWFLAKEG
jgi:hypothetical protein